MFDVVNFIVDHGVEVTLKYDIAFRNVTITQKKKKTTNENSDSTCTTERGIRMF